MKLPELNEGIVVENENDIKLETIVDSKLTDETELKFGKNSYKYGEISENFPINGDTPARVLVMWDDVCQYTSIGLIQLINELYDTDAKIDLDHFFERNNEYVNGMKYVYKLFENILTPKQIDAIKRKYYWELIQISPKSTVYESIVSVNTFFNKLTIFFPYHFKNDIKLETGLNKIFNADSKHITEFDFKYQTDTGFHDLFLENHYNCIITPSIGATYNFIIKNNMQKIDILGPSHHNGLDDELIDLFARYEKFPKPNYCGLHIYYEQIVEE